MQNKTYHTMDKAEWGEGPWLEEPDKAQFTDEATGLPCLIVRNQFGSLCGYVGVPNGHPYYGKHYDAVPDVEVHGGLTFANKCHPGEEEGKGICHKVEPGENDDVWWLGFDCGHAFDISPAMAARYKNQGISIPGEVYRDFNYITEEIKQLAKQLAEVK